MNVIEKISMIESQAMTPKNVVIDSCRNCPTFWFDAGELDLLNGIKPKFRKNDPKKVRLLEDQTLSPEDLRKKETVRRGHQFQYTELRHKPSLVSPFSSECLLLETHPLLPS